MSGQEVWVWDLPVGRMEVCGWYMWGVGRWLETGSGRMGWCSVCLSCESRFFV